MIRLNSRLLIFILSFFFSVLVHAFETQSTKVVSVALDNTTQKVAVFLEEDISTNCSNGMEFSYSSGTLSARYYSALAAAKFSNLPVKIVYESNNGTCVPTQLTVMKTE